MLRDVGSRPIETSLGLLDCLHQRWVMLMRGIDEEEWKRNSFTRNMAVP